MNQKPTKAEILIKNAKTMPFDDLVIDIEKLTMKIEKIIDDRKKTFQVHMKKVNDLKKERLELKRILTAKKQLMAQKVRGKDAKG